MTSTDDPERLVASDAPTLMTAGRFAALTLLSAKALRIYGERGCSPEILTLYDEVHAWITDAGRTPVGPPREIWHNGPNDPDPLRLTIAWPYAPVL